jgi:hypothetical protein
LTLLIIFESKTSNLPQTTIFKALYYIFIIRP